MGRVLELRRRAQQPEGKMESNLPEKEFRVMIVMIIQDPRKRMETQTKKLQEKINKELEDLKEKQT